MGMLVNETFARELWGNTDVLGEALPVMEHWSTAMGGEPRVAGVLADTAFSHPKEVVHPMLFNPSASTARMDSMLLHTQLSQAEDNNSLSRLTYTGALDMANTAVYLYLYCW